MARPRGKAPSPTVLDKERQVVALRRQGLTWQEIAEQVGYASASGASEAYYRASTRVVVENIEELRALENDRLDNLFAAVWEQALQGDNKALDSCLKIMTRRAKLLGLDAKVEHRVELNQNYYDAESIDQGVRRIQRAYEKAIELGIDLDEDTNSTVNKSNEIESYEDYQ